ncbi:SDR family NAD(P)-dependent oxidoreductase [Campylobacter geochelonis]|uniref:NADP-dependent l-serine/l-allo-threonine dehydrogenase ydfg n=1 Tax=Campylobacter geochelonis TaxID=1780362 RepID=A0A128EI87_9BACT|nr:SDR family NAD(P)-dependent oxidoreductase [Campylobacter geochelonis]QKF71167.1 short-chain dehydrogenase/reductase, subgroup 5 [Campylobacter geochelonis]CZE48526.1 NADP-dependent l-serine/l-allo-threonine dehydrogenase ydfg [Campylobacter geochelonis]
MNKTAFITGATSGFGEASAKALARDGYNIIILGRRKDRLEKLANELKPTKTHIIKADVRDKDAILSAVEALPEEFKRIEILVNNAGLALGQEKVLDASLDDFETMIDTNIKGLLYVTKAVLPIMSAQKSGYIFNIGSIAGNWPYPGGNVYGATKAFVKQFSFNLRNDIKGTNIRVTNIEPGIAKTEFSLVRFKGDEAKSEAVYDGTKYLVADDIARIISDCAKMPAHVNINSLEVMATTQTWAGFAFER